MGSNISLTYSWLSIIERNPAFTSEGQRIKCFYRKSVVQSKRPRNVLAINKFKSKTSSYAHRKTYLFTRKKYLFRSISLKTYYTLPLSVAFLAAAVELADRRNVSNESILLEYANASNYTGNDLTFFLFVYRLIRNCSEVSNRSALTFSSAINN